MAQPTTQADDFMNSPTVSIRLPVHNGEPYLRRAVDSLLAQDYVDFELVICDNASTDNTAEICQSYARGDKRIRYYRNEINIGVNPNRDRVFELAGANTSHGFRTTLNTCLACSPALWRC